MSAMKDYMMWLDDRGIATWSNEIDELIVSEGTNIYAPSLVDEYKDDAKSNPMVEFRAVFNGLLKWSLVIPFD